MKALTLAPPQAKGWHRAALTLALLGWVATATAADVMGPAVSATFGPDGRLWRVTPYRSEVLVDVSDDLGRTFRDAVRVNPRKQRMHASAEDRPGIVVDEDGRIFVLYFADAKQKWTSFLTVSHDGGKTFAPPLHPSSAAETTPHYQARMHLAADGRLYVLWMDERDRRDQPGGTVYFTSLTGREPELRPNRKLYAPLCECCRLAVDTNADGVATLLARFVFDGQTRDMGSLQFGPAGALGSVKRLSHDEWSIEACPEHGPSLSIGADGTYHYAWFTLGRARQGLYYANLSSDGTSSAPMQLGSLERLAGHADVMALGHTIAIVWQTFDGQQTTIKLMTSQDNGENWSIPADIASAASGADYPFLLTHGGRIYVSWYSQGGGYRLIPVAPE